MAAPACGWCCLENKPGMKKFVLVHRSNTGLGDRLVDIWAFSAFAKCLNMELVTYWPRLPIESQISFGTRLRQSDLSKLITFPENVTFVRDLNQALEVEGAVRCFHPFGPGTNWPRSFYERYIEALQHNRYSDLMSDFRDRLLAAGLPRWFKPVRPLDISAAAHDEYFAREKIPGYEEYFRAVIEAARQTRPKATLKKRIDRLLTDNMISVHLRRGDKVNKRPTPWEIHNNALVKLDADTRACIKIFSTGAIKRIFVCSDSKGAKKDYVNFSNEQEMKTAEAKAVGKMSQMLLDFFLLSSSKCIIQSQKFSSFSNAAAMANQVPIINMIEIHDERSLHKALKPMDNVYFFHQLSEAQLLQLADTK